MTLLDNIEQLVAAYPLLAFGAVFLAGVLSSASPCVLVAVPLVIGFVDGYAGSDRFKAFRYTCAFVLGIALTFTAFGAAAGLLGTMFGTLGGWWYGAAGLVAIVMGMQLFGLFELRLPIRRDFRPKQGDCLVHCYSGFFSAQFLPPAPPRRWWSFSLSSPSRVKFCKASACSSLTLSAIACSCCWPGPPPVSSSRS